jgi:hypothetical protein
VGHLSRRAFLTTGSLAAATAGLLASAPATALPGLLGGAGAETDAALAEEGAGALGGELEGVVVAHVRDLTTGEISVYSGTEETVIRDPAMAARLARAAR